ncbi:MAG TPA: hypothetical protein ENO22_05715 [candidate division Zixibacteria bacterium]|nr:hypothetical protein [candidate division Zixibacteria bacterium]
MKGPSGYWTVPRLWPEGECFIIGGGPSLRGFDIKRLRGKRIIAVNNAYRMADWIDCLFFGDCRWYNMHAKQLLSFAGLKVTTCEQHLDKPGIKVVKRQNKIRGLSTSPSILAWNLSSGACAIGLAYHFGVKRIILLGFDMRVVEGRYNYHDDYDPPANPKGKNPYPRFLRPFPDIAHSLKQKNIECFNACLDSALDVFPKVALEDLI